MLNIGIGPLRAARIARGRTAAQVCEASGISSTTYAFMERGASPTPHQLVQLARGLNMDPGALAITLATGVLVADPEAAGHDRQ